MNTTLVLSFPHLKWSYFHTSNRVQVSGGVGVEIDVAWVLGPPQVLAAPQIFTKGQKGMTICRETNSESQQTHLIWPWPGPSKSWTQDRPKILTASTRPPVTALTVTTPQSYCSEHDTCFCAPVECHSLTPPPPPASAASPAGRRRQA